MTAVYASVSRKMPRAPAATAWIHGDEGELYYVIEGSATLGTGRMPDQPLAVERRSISRRVTW